MVFCLGHSHRIFTFLPYGRRCKGAMAKMQSCEGKREVGRQNGEVQRCEDEGMILISLFRIHTFAFSSSPFFLYFGQLHTSLFRYRFRMILFVFSAHAPNIVAAIVLAIKHH